MNCGFCGTKINDGYDMCGSCGAIYEPHRGKRQRGKSRIINGIKLTILCFVIFGAVGNRYEVSDRLFLITVLPFAMIAFGIIAIIHARYTYRWYK